MNVRLFWVPTRQVGQEQSRCYADSESSKINRCLLSNLDNFWTQKERLWIVWTLTQVFQAIWSRPQTIHKLRLRCYHLYLDCSLLATSLKPFRDTSRTFRWGGNANTLVERVSPRRSCLFPQRRPWGGTCSYWRNLWLKVELLHWETNDNIGDGPVN